jgi:hypothetical protein|tara:strand:+ start:1016 stop:1444 length:429 start_codon:yes stop_codon:yes gene_type:complete
VSFKSFSQQDTPVVILTEEQARLVVKDLIQYDNLKLITKKLEDRISLFEQKEIDFLARLQTKDDIIASQKEYISTQEDIIDAKKKLNFGGYIGVQTHQITLTNPILFGEVTVGLSKIDVGARVFVQPDNPSGYGIVVRYKIF